MQTVTYVVVGFIGLVTVLAVVATAVVVMTHLRHLAATVRTVRTEVEPELARLQAAAEVARIELERVSEARDQLGSRQP
jgi:hypothetical protein